MKEIEIPEGYEARIVGNKVIILPKESKDERIRKEIIEYLKLHDKGENDYAHTMFSEWFAWLEKQKEQKPIPKFKVGDCIYDKRDSYNRNVIREVGKDYYINAFAQKMDMAYTDTNFEFLERLDDDILPNQPAEWSEEDDKKRKCLIKGLEDRMGFNWTTQAYNREQLIEWLKSLRPMPKQEWSEEDEKRILQTITALESEGSRYLHIDGRIRYKDLISWLKSIRPQPNQEWSKEDEVMRWQLINAFTDKNNSAVDEFMGLRVSKTEIIDWLKSLRP